MTIDTWMPSAIIAGIAASVLYHKRHTVAAAAIVVIPPAALSLYVVTNHGNEIWTAALLSAAWLTAAALAGLPFFLLQRKQTH